MVPDQPLFAPAVRVFNLKAPPQVLGEKQNQNGDECKQEPHGCNDTLPAE
jgi:hypothetical protein